MWLKITNKDELRESLGDCLNYFNNKYVNLESFECKVNGTDPFEDLRASVGRVQRVTIELDENYVPIESKWLPIIGECEWRYEIDGLWSTVVITIVSTAAIVIIILLIVLLVFVQKHRHEKRNRLDHQLLSASEPQSV